MRIFGFALLLLISACHSSAPSVYQQPLPDRRDIRALSNIGSRLRPEDKASWSALVGRMTDPTAAPLRSKTVGEAISRWNAQRTCLQVHAKGQEAAGIDDRTRNREIGAFNDCLEMEV